MKKLVILLITVIMLASSVLSVYAANGAVTYSGRSGEFIFAPGSKHSPTDLFPNFKGVMPGDSLIQQITVKNDETKNVKVKIYIRSLGAHAESKDFLSKLSLKVRKSNDNTMAYMFDAAASETAQLSDWVYLGTLYSGGIVNLDVILDVPVELDNTYQNQIGYLDWEFKVEEFEVEPGDPVPPPTGDNDSLILWIILIALAIIIILILFKKRKREQNEDDE